VNSLCLDVLRRRSLGPQETVSFLGVRLIFARLVSGCPAGLPGMCLLRANFSLGLCGSDVSAQGFAGPRHGQGVAGAQCGCVG
jgi:hypothetical protein